MKALNEDITRVLNEIGLPETTKYLGYVVHLPEEDEFLMDIKETASKVLRRFAKLPEMAKRYQSLTKAKSDAKKCKQETLICYLFETQQRFYVAEIDE